jgi:hypothetical protein
MFGRGVLTPQGSQKEAQRWTGLHVCSGWVHGVFLIVFFAVLRPSSPEGVNSLTVKPTRWVLRVFWCFHPMRGWPGRIHKRKRMVAWRWREVPPTTLSTCLWLLSAHWLLIQTLFWFCILFPPKGSHEITWAPWQGFVLKLGPVRCLNPVCLLSFCFVFSGAPSFFVFFLDHFYELRCLHFFGGSSSTPVFQF